MSRALDNAKEFIESKSGIFISSQYSEGNQKKRLLVTYKCTKGHLRENIRVDQVKAGWCAQCIPKSIEDAHKLAAEREGKFLSDEYTTSGALYTWSCKKGHVFQSTYGNVRSGHWCKQCLCYSLDDIKKIARERGGECLSTHMNNTDDRLQFKCHYEHTWETSAHHVIYDGTWCGECNAGISERTCRQILEFLYKKSFPKVRPDWLISSHGTRLELDGMCEELSLCFEYQGLQHYENVTYFGNNNLQIRQELDAWKVLKCAENNVKLLVIPYTVKYLELYTYIRSLCPDVIATTPEQINYYKDLHLHGVQDEKLKELQEHLNVNYPGCKVISQTYLNYTADMEFLCAENHPVKLSWSHVKRNRRFCKICPLNTKKRKRSD